MERNDIQIYNALRNQIEHEDDLINQRTNWLLTINGFLFTAYGFSMTAQSSFCSPNCNPLPATPEPIENIRMVLAFLAIGVSLVMLFGTGAASIAILKCIGDWKIRNQQNENNLPEIVSSGILGMGAYAGLLPTYCLPILIAAAWCLLIRDNVYIQAAGTIFTLFAIVGLVFMSPISFGLRLWRR